MNTIFILALHNIVVGAKEVEREEISHVSTTIDLHGLCKAFRIIAKPLTDMHAIHISCRIFYEILEVRFVPKRPIPMRTNNVLAKFKNINLLNA